MKAWRVKSSPFSGTSYKELHKKASNFLSSLKGKSKRKAYIRSTSFSKRKVFVDYFWTHLFQKPKGQRVERLRLLPCTVELLRDSTIKPTIKLNPNKKKEHLYRFIGKTKQEKIFVVQVKDAGKSLQLMSVFPRWRKPSACVVYELRAEGLTYRTMISVH